MVETNTAFIGWTILWIVTLILPPGSKAINSAYRINFLHGLFSSIVAALSIMDYIDTNVATTATISYFIVDFVNMLLNDFFFKVKSYQVKKSNLRQQFFYLQIQRIYMNI